MKRERGEGDMGEAQDARKCEGEGASRFGGHNLRTAARSRSSGALESRTELQFGNSKSDSGQSYQEHEKLIINARWNPTSPGWLRDNVPPDLMF